MFPARGSEEYKRWLIFALTEGGKSAREIAKIYGVSLTTIRNDAKKLGLTKINRSRKPSWYAARKGIPELGSAEWLIQFSKKTSAGIEGMARLLRVNPTFLREQLIRLGLELERFYGKKKREGKKKRIKVKCSNCGKEIEILPSRLRYYSHHFCGKKCWKEYQRKKKRKV